MTLVFVSFRLSCITNYTGQKMISPKETLRCELIKTKQRLTKYIRDLEDLHNVQISLSSLQEEEINRVANKLYEIDAALNILDSGGSSGMGISLDLPYAE